MAEISLSRRGVHWFAILTTACTFVLIASGGLVTSHGVGMAVPDWPTTFGYNMFLFPISHWIGGIFYEHTHRLIASGVGLLTVILAVWLLAVEPRRWVKLLGIYAGIAVVVQGVLGGLRVRLIANEIGIFHGMLAQSFFVALAILAIATSPAFVRGRWFGTPECGTLRWIALSTTLLIFLQLGIAASMRHAHAGLSIPDFPLAYGQLLPATNSASVEAINAARAASGEMATSAALIWLQMAHRLVAVLIFAGVIAYAWRAMATRAIPATVRAWSFIWVATIVAQIFLGAWTIWSNKAADVATAHVALGALALFFGGVVTFGAFRAARTAGIEGDFTAAGRRLAHLGT
jgi:cytochrome c oxidase assembly protein subunit 15